ncbi:UDP-glucuronate 4-epimerase [Anseongella ginsenosidimutans]|uniref:UDP-glucuronate 4-epimerase n=1 Tax=Anseongella ginsenosidimutans TaxID=496056 RepID=A0A4R3KWW8_9SPHI|nr:GDP-mannose 4,6-dehydratase [Anseongella ginsenosidimutans]QEC51037.1 NAD-dependent epimerase/dehydratase family protein [Anseongella ginsenosidimutans]TCS90307.1 UDP-glucuronate 4-epimerase [Anseongella ginsenosidimutans]
MNHVLVTGGAGFIGSSLCEHLLKDPGVKVTCIDNFDPFYPESFKRRNLSELEKNPRFKLVEQDISELGDLEVWLPDDYDAIVHLAAKAGVRPSIQQPAQYQQVNVIGTQNLLDFARIRGIKQFVFGSSSSVYGINPNVPWREEEKLMPISPYASTKLSGEMIGHTYMHLYGIRFIALRFFTVYGPRQRPDLAIHKFTRDIFQGDPITVYGDGSSSRDYTYVDDIVQGILAAVRYDQSSFEIINLGNHQGVRLSEMIETIEKISGRKATIDRRPEQPGDVPQTYADISKAGKLLNYHPKTNFEQGIRRFTAWFEENQDWLLL